MSRQEPQRSSILTGHLVKAFPNLAVYHVARDVQDMIKIATRLQNLAIQACNGFQTYDHKHDSKAEERAEKAQETARQKFRLILAASYPGVVATFGGDPRGNVVKITIPGERGDSWGGEGFGVYR